MHLKTLVVITIIPLFSNAIQFWLTDNVIKRKWNEEEIHEYVLTHSNDNTLIVGTKDDKLEKGVKNEKDINEEYTIGNKIA